MSTPAPSQTPWEALLEEAVVDGDLQMAKRALQNGIDANCYIDYEGTTGYTPLIVATKNNDRKMVELLLLYGAETEITTNSVTPVTALYVAAAEGHLDALQTLVKHGADIEALNASGHMRPVVEAGIRNQAHCVSYLLHQGAQYDQDNYFFIQRHYPENTETLNAIESFWENGKRHEETLRKQKGYRSQQDENAQNRQTRHTQLRKYTKRFGK